MRPVVSLLLVGGLTYPAYAQSAAMRGFLTKDIADEQKIEQQAQAVPDPARFRKYMDFLAAEPHHAGSPRSKAVAEYLLGTLKEWGLDAHIEQFEALLPYPTVRQVEVVGPKPYVAKLREPAVPEDPDSADAGGLPPYNAYAASGEAPPLVMSSTWLTRARIHRARRTLHLSEIGRARASFRDLWRKTCVHR